MQENIITLPVDVANNATIVNQPYNRYEEQQNRTTYIGAGHLPEERDMMTIYRTLPTKNGNFKGVAKSAVKFTQDVSVPGVDSNTQLTAPLIFDLSVSMPVGCSAAILKEMRQRAIALLDDDDLMDSISIQLMV